MNSTQAKRPLQPTLLRLFAAVALISALPFTRAETVTAKITGQVINGSNGLVLRGAAISIDGTNLSTVSDLQGSFVLSGVPAGRHTLHVTYLGTPDLNESVDLTAGQTLSVTLTMKEEVVAMSAYHVESLREGQAKALNQEKNSDTLVNIVGADSIGRFPDPNTAEALQRLPGISLERDTGEGRYVNIRGLSAEFNSVTSDGQLVPSNESGSRRVNLNVIPSSTVSQIEVIKSKTPDLPADGLGGAVNLVSRSAFDSDHATTLQGSFSAGKLTYKHNSIFDGSLNAGQQFGPEKQFGVLLSGQYSRVPRAFDDIEQGYDVQPISGAPGLVTTGTELRNYRNILTHRSVALALDARPDAADKYFLRLSYNRYDDDRRRRRFTPNWGDGSSFTAGANPGDVIVRDVTFQSDLQDELTKQELANISAGGKNLLGASELDYELGYSFGAQKIPYNNSVTFLRDAGDVAYYNLNNPEFPTFGVLNGANIHDPTQSILSKITTNTGRTLDDTWAGGTNLKVPNDLGANRGYWKFGAHASDRTKKNSATNAQLKGSAVKGTTLASLAEFDDPAFLYRDRYHIGPEPDVSLSRAFIDSHAALFTNNQAKSDGSFYHASERILAGYALYAMDADRLHTVAGVRVEGTRTKYSAFIFPAGGTEFPTHATRTYTDAFPSLNVRYNASKELVLRAAFSTSIVRPQFGDVVPHQNVDDSTKKISGGNAALKPTHSYDFDASADYYLPSLGVFSAGVFYKNIKDYVFTRTTVLHGGQYDGYQFSGPENLSHSHLEGAELSCNRQFTFLPEPFNGLGVYANATFISSRAEIRPGETHALPKQANAVENLALFYEKYGVTARLALTHTGSFLYSVGDDAFTPGAADAYYSRNTQLDFTASYALSDRFSVFTDVLNLTNQPLRFHEAVYSRPIQQEYYDIRFDVGVKFSL